MRKPRPYQTAAIESARKQLETNNSTIIVLPTGMGKTYTVSKIISEWDRGNCLFLAHTRELIEQSADHLAEELGYRPAVEMNIQGAEVDTLYQGGMVVVGSVQTMYGDKRLNKYARHPFGLIIIDETHRAVASTYRKIIDFFREKNPSLKVLGITATPNRTDGTALGIIYDSVAYQVSINDAIRDGWLVPILQEYVIVDQLNFDGLGTKKNEYGEQDFKREDLAEVMTEEEALHKQAIAIIEKAGNQSLLGFCASVEHAKTLAEVINRYDPGSSEFVDGKTLKEHRKNIVTAFKNGQIKRLFNFGVFTEGFDAPNCSAIAMLRPTKSLGLYTQMLGRGLRPLPGTIDGIDDADERRLAILTSNKPRCLVLDFVGTSEHKLASCYDVLGGNYNEAVRELAQQEAKRSKRNINELMEQAAALLELEQKMDSRKHITADGAVYQSYEVDPFADGPELATNPDMGGVKRGGASDAQVAFLVNLGVRRETALGYSKRQAGAVIDELSVKRCTAKQAAVLQKHGIPIEGIGVERASRIIDSIAANGWRRPKELPE